MMLVSSLASGEVFRRGQDQDTTDGFPVVAAEMLEVAGEQVGWLGNQSQPGGLDGPWEANLSDGAG